jgi:hypothetical protein
MNTFDDLENANETNKNRKPFFAINHENDIELLAWLNGEINYLKEENEARHRKIKANLARYKGIQYQFQDARSTNRDRQDDSSKFSPKIVVNNLFDVTEQRVSRLVKYKPAVAVIPTNDEYQDKISSKIAKRFLEHVQTEQQFDEKIHQLVRYSVIGGEAYLAIEWDKDSGPVHPDFDDSEQIPLVDADGQVKRHDDGSVIMIDRTVHIGDVCYKTYLAIDVLLENSRKYEEVNYGFMIDTEYTEALKRDYPEAANDIQEDSTGTYYDYSKFEERNLNGRSIVYRFFHKKSKYVPDGFCIYFTKDTILKKKKLGYNHGDMPWERLVDIENPDELHGESFYNNIKGIANQYNHLTNMIIRNQALVSHPKWFVPRGSVDVKQLNNDVGVVTYKGAASPVLAQANPTPAEIFNFRTELKNEIYQGAGLSGVSRGEPPAGIKAGVALQFLHEQENERQNASIARFNNFIVRVARKTLATQGQFYKKEDQRTLMVLGKNQDWTSKNYDPSHLAKTFSIKILNSSALPQSRAARSQVIMDYYEIFPEIFPKEQVAEMLDLGQSEKFLTEAASAVRAAEMENEMILNGEAVPEPEPYEFLVLHWKTHVKAVQDPSFKTSAPPEVQQALKDHIMATEMLMIDKARINPVFEEEVSMLIQFPLFYSLRAAGTAPGSSPGRGPAQSAGPMPMPPGAPPMAPEGMQDIDAINPGPIQPGGEPIQMPQDQPLEPSGAE